MPNVWQVIGITNRCVSFVVVCLLPRACQLCFHSPCAVMLTWFNAWLLHVISEDVTFCGLMSKPFSLSLRLFLSLSLRLFLSLSLSLSLSGYFSLSLSISRTFFTREVSFRDCVLTLFVTLILLIKVNRQTFKVLHTNSAQYPTVTQ